jgi:uncharacterized protein YdhG (YjbR/CyaY superfamily)
MKENLAKNIEEFILNQTPELVEKLSIIRNVIKEVCPEAEESISYMMPAFKYKKKPLCYFGVFKTHIGFFPTPGPIAFYEKELKSLKCSKGTVQIPFNIDLPIDLIKKLVSYRMNSI